MLDFQGLFIGFPGVLNAMSAAGEVSSKLSKVLGFLGSTGFGRAWPQVVHCRMKSSIEQTCQANTLFGRHGHSTFLHLDGPRRQNGLPESSCKNKAISTVAGG